MALFERADTGKKVTWLSILGLVLVPVLIGAGFVLAVWKADDRLDSVQAAIVNNDEGAEVDGQTVPLGRQLAAGLVDPDVETNIDWVLSDDEDSEEGLQSGKYVTVVTIPEGFSEAVMSSSNDDPMSAEQATLQVENSKVSPFADALIGQTIAQTARTVFNQEFAQQFVDGVFVGFNDMGEQFGEVADGAAELDDGASQLADGTTELDEGMGQFVVGLNELDANGSTLADGADQLASGAGDLVRGIGELDAGASALSDGLGQLDEGASALPESTQQLADGAGALSDGVSELDEGVAALPESTQQLADGADQYTSGVDTLVCTLAGDGVTDTDYAEYCRGLLETAAAGGADGAGAGAGGAGGLTDPAALTQLTDGVVASADGASTLAEGLAASGEGAAGLADGLVAYRDGLEGQSAQVEQAGIDGLVASGQMTQDKADALCADIPEGADPNGQMCAGIQQAFVAGMSAGLTGAADGLGTKDPDTGQSLVSGAQALADGIGSGDDTAEDRTLAGGANALAAGLGSADDSGEDGTLAGGVNALVDGVRQMMGGSLIPADQATQLLGGGAGLRDGTQQLADGIAPLADGIGALDEGASQLADGTQQLADGIAPLVDGIGASADGASQLSDGVGQLNSGAGEMSSGVGEFADGVGAYTDGVGQVAEGAGELGEGVSGLSDGASQLADGTGQLADGLEEGKDQLPSYSEDEREHLGEVVTAAIGGDDEDLLSGINTASTIALLLAMALWIGALVTYTVMRAVSATALVSRKTSLAIMLRGLLPGAVVGFVQAIVLSAISLLVLDTGFFDTLRLFAFALLGAAAFVAVNHALVAWCGGVGRVISVVFVVLAVAGSVLGAVPGFYHAVAPYLPLTPFMDGITSIATGVGGIGGAAASLLVWALVAMAASVVAVARQRTLSPAALAARTRSALA
ncbi:YhgE/Pip domain-containing protein [Brevibacterium samyangense]|uniref:YhgE/Pip domain-containing protein n=1 Tax=Brevibacterium samyangense TaxID=366888 RepID=A0ABP5EIG6_9MICO